MKAPCSLVVCQMLLASLWVGLAQPVTIDFDTIPAANGLPLYPVPLESRLSNQLAATHGIVLASESHNTQPPDPYDGAPFVAVIRRGMVSTAPTNAIASANIYGQLFYFIPIRVRFVLPSDPLVDAVTDVVSIHCDGPGSVKLEAFDMQGTLVASNSASVSQPTTVSVAHAGIHALRISTMATIATVHAMTFAPPEPPLRVSLQTEPPRVSWRSVSNRQYQVQISPSLQSGLWTNLGSVITGNGTTNTVNDPSVGQVRRFYRVQEMR